MRNIFLSLLLILLVFGVQANPKDDIKADMEAHRWAAADAKLVKVLKEHPNSAQAHYWMAQVKAREGMTVVAREHLDRAKAIAPDLSFASSRQAVADFEQKLTPVQIKNPPAHFQGQPAATVSAPTPTPMPESGGHGLFFWLFVLGIPLVIAYVLFRRVTGGASGGASGERARLQAELKDVGNDLRDAEKAVDARSALNAEQKMAIADRLSQAQGDLAREAVALATRQDFEPTYQVIMRLRDVAAEARGEERPSIRAERERQATLAAQGGPVGAQQAPSTGPGAVVAGLGGLAAGVALGSLLSGSSHAAGRSDASSHTPYEPISNDALDPIDTGSSIDFGQDDASDWGSSTDTGGGGDNDW